MSEKEYTSKRWERDRTEAGTIDPVSGRPALEVSSIMHKVNNALTEPSIWRLVQLLRGNARRIDSGCILYASVKGRINVDEFFGGKRREELLAAEADETIAKLEESKSKPRSRSLAARQIVGTEQLEPGLARLQRTTTPFLQSL
ncbi:hypothetical protein PILCRDRAFT_821659 [Piloderma croceum F 1598]|uniref:Uncharacterized protein n=1 Tax=Piloderma croceum (strain F 1598) TaxID=765440 RepID=A0A0C3B4S9_PILCF|nr:hypothetical protein PILCRDRAFT_821659 [Piloderma croceum F 1598]